MPIPDQPPRLEFPLCDIRPFRAGNTGVPYVTTLESGRAGPHVMVNALTHGNEICGAAALASLFERGLRARRGRLTLSFANVAAYERFDPLRPFRSRFVDEDFNRLWSAKRLRSKRSSCELDRARELKPVVDRVDHLLDIHSTDLACEPMLLAGVQKKGRELALALRFPRTVVLDAGHKAGTRLRDYGPFDDPGSSKSALLVECGQHFGKQAPRVAMETTLRFLRHFGLLDRAFASELPPDDSLPAPVVIEVSEAVTIAGERFRFADDYVGFEVIPRAGTVIAQDGERKVTTPYDECILVMPSRFPKKGLTAVRFGRRVS